MADADDADFSFVVESIRRAVRSQREYADNFLESAQDGARTIGEQFLELCDLLEVVAGKYEARFSATSDDIDRQVILNLTRELLASTRDLQEQRPWLDAAQTPPIDLGSFYFLSGLAKAIVRSDSELTVVASHEGSYATLVNPFRDIKHPIPADIVLVTLVPHRETRTGLLHPLLVHEIGHGAAKVHNHTEELRSTLFSAEVDGLLNDGANDQASKTGRSSSDERAILDERLNSWIEEVYCDAVATACLGATYLFSFAVEVLPDGADGCGLKHPSARQRVKLITQHLDRNGWLSVLRQEVPDFAQWIERVAGEQASSLGPDDEALEKAIEIMGRGIQDKVDNHIGTRASAPNDVALDTVADLLEQHIPPAQMPDGSAIDRPTIIVGCWFFALKARGGAIETLATAVDSDELAELLPYALELSSVVDRWQAA